MSTEVTVEKPQGRDVYTVPEVARLLGTSVAHIYRMTEAGKLPRVKCGHLVRIPIDAYERWLREGAA